MRKLGADIGKLVSDLGRNSDEARVNLRIQQVRNRYRAAIESVYRDAAPLHLAHTNNVIITRVGQVNTLIVYVDDSLFAAELNAQRELIKLRLLELFGEEIDDFQIRTSRWKKYRDNHPFVDSSAQPESSNVSPVPLSDDERSFVSDTAAVVEDEKLRKSLERAMTADLEWKKGEKVKASRENTK